MSMTKGTPLSSQMIKLEEMYEKSQFENFTLDLDNRHLKKLLEERDKQIVDLKTKLDIGYDQVLKTVNKDLGEKLSDFIKRNVELSKEKHKLKEENEELKESREKYRTTYEQLLINVAGYKNRIDILQSENKHLYDLNVAAEEKAEEKKNNSTTGDLEARYKKYVFKMRENGEGLNTARRNACYALIEELFDEVSQETSNTSIHKLAFAIKLLKRGQG